MTPYRDTAYLAELSSVFSPKKTIILSSIFYFRDNENNTDIILTEGEIAEHMTDEFGPVRSLHPREQRIDDVMDAPL